MDDIRDLAAEKSEGNIDSIALGSATKGGAIKVYGDYSNPEEFKAKIQAAIDIRKWANGVMV